MFRYVQKYFFSCMQAIRNQKIRNLLKAIDEETDPVKKTEKEVVFRIRGTSLGGMAGSTAFLEFKESYYDKLTDEEARKRVDQVLQDILESHGYDLMIKAKTSYVCADIKLEPVISMVEYLVHTSKKGTSEERLLRRSLDALKKGISISELTYEELRRRREI